MIRALIVDDEPLARSRVRLLAASHCDVEIIAECSSGREAEQVMTSETPALLFLDVEMPDAGGFAIAAPGREVVSRRGRVDATLARTVSRGWGVVQPFASAGWRREYANAARPLTVRFLQDAAGTPVTFATDDPDTTWGEVAAGATFVFAGGHSAFIEWRQRMAHDFLDERLLAIGWRMELP